MVVFFGKGDIMRLQIENFAKIAKADINIDGITVIAGENNTGKSTIGKALYCIFNSLYDLENKIYKNRLDYIETILRNIPIKNEFGAKGFRTRKTSNDIHKIANDLLNSTEKSKRNTGLVDVCIKAISELDEKKVLDKDTIQEFGERLNDILKVPNKAIINAIINRYFDAEFMGQINHVNDPGSVANVRLTIKDKSSDLNITNNEVSKLDLGVQITGSAIYFDDPFVLNELDERFPFYLNVMKDATHSRSLLEFLHTKKSANNVVEEALLKGKMTNVLSSINSVVGGEIVDGDNGEGFQENGLNKPLHFSNLASGLKTFIIIKKLLLNGALVEKGVLVLDEPEVHLHPEWQLKFAEIIVLLQKEFNLHTLLTTHSPYFLRAIEVYSAKHKIADRCSYYMTELKENKIEIVNTTNCTDEIYKKLAQPFTLLDKIQFGE